MPSAPPCAGGDGESAQAEVLDFLQTPGVLARNGPCRRIDTHAAIVLLAGDSAWKLKRAVRYPYLDFSTAEKRHATLDAELRLNRRTAPDLYRGVHPLTRNGATLAIGGDGPVIDWILEMKRFPDGALLDDRAQAGRLDVPLMLRLAGRIHDFHEAAERIVSHGAAARFLAVIDGNRESLAPFAAGLGEARIDRLLDAQRAAWLRHRRLLDARGRGGKIRHGHGDLHLGNIALIEGEPVLFDCLEFSAELAVTDTLYDLAFLLMDLWRRGLRAEASLVFNRYVDLSADEDGVRLLPLFLSVRATIRAHVRAATAARTGDAAGLREASDLLSLADRMIAPVPPRLVAVAGLSGTGKSALSRALAADIGAPPGARILRSDVLRKRIAHVPPEQKLPPALYDPLATEAVYALLADIAGHHLAHGTAVIADAVAAQPDQRAALVRAADHAHAPFSGLWLEAAEGVRLARVSSRGADASDADAAVVVAQSKGAPPPPADWQRLPADAPLPEVIERARQALGNAS